ncbi:MAG: hypothetical protein ACTSWQ_00865 [Candidatus Thorarchaeota archaeon]
MRITVEYEIDVEMDKEDVGRLGTTEYFQHLGIEVARMIEKETGWKTKTYSAINNQPEDREFE